MDILFQLLFTSQRTVSIKPVCIAFALASAEGRRFEGFGTLRIYGELRDETSSYEQLGVQPLAPKTVNTVNDLLQQVTLV